MPKLSVITVCYNEENEIEDTCQSLIQQTFDDFEWIIIDGASKDNTLKILDKYKDRISILVSEKDRGIYDAMNKGIALSKGEYLLFLNGGDYLHDKNVLKDIFAMGSNADIIYGGEKKLKRDGSYQIINQEFDFSLKFWVAKYHLRHQASFIKKELFEKYGMYDLHYRSAGDFDAFMRFIHKYKCQTFYAGRMVSVFKMYDGLSSSNYELGMREIKRSISANLCSRSETFFIIQYLFKRNLLRFFINKCCWFVFDEDKRHALRKIYKNY